MSTMHIIQTTLESIVIIAIIYGFIREYKLIAWEQKHLVPFFRKIKAKVCKKIFNAIVKYEKRAQVK